MEEQVYKVAIQTTQPFWQSMDWSGISSIATAISAIATLVLAWLTRNMVKEMAETREETSRPYVVVDFIYKKNSRALYLIVKNIGKTSACNVAFKSTPSIDGSSTKFGNSKKVDVFEDRFGSTIPSIVPGWEYETLVSALKDFSEEVEYNVEVMYESVEGKKYKSKYILNTRPFKRILWATSSDDTEELSKAMIKKVDDTNDQLAQLVKVTETMIKQKRIIRPNRIRQASWGTFFVSYAQPSERAMVEKMGVN